MSEKEIEIFTKLKKLENEDELFFVKNKQHDIERILNLKTNTLHFYLHKFKIKLLKEREKAIINYFYTQDIKKLTLEKIQKDFNLTHKQSVTRIIRRMFNVNLTELKKGIK